VKSSLLPWLFRLWLLLLQPRRSVAAVAIRNLLEEPRLGGRLGW